jgi:HAD superfamily hydrolase (TIGR01549 family)
VTQVDAVLFDVDGTLIDSRSAIVAAYREATEAVLGRPFVYEGAALEELIQLHSRDGCRAVAGEADAHLVDALISGFSERYRAHEADIDWFPGAVDSLRALHGMGCRLGIVTTKARDRLDSLLGSSPIGTLFDVTISGHDAVRHKPDPLPIVLALEELDLPSSRALYVGDGPNDVRAAHGAGVPAVVVAFGFHPEEARAEQPEHWLEDYAELPRLVQGLRGSGDDRRGVPAAT